MHLREPGFEGEDWIYLAQNQAVVDTVMNFRISIKGRGANSGDYC